MTYVLVMFRQCYVYDRSIFHLSSGYVLSDTFNTSPSPIFLCEGNIRIFTSSRWIHPHSWHHSEKVCACTLHILILQHSPVMNFFTVAFIGKYIHPFTASGFQWPSPSAQDPGMSCWYFPASPLMCCTPLNAPAKSQNKSEPVRNPKLPLSTLPPSSWFLFWPCPSLASSLLCWTLYIQWGSRYPCTKRMKSRNETD